MSTAWDGDKETVQVPYDVTKAKGTVTMLETMMSGACDPKSIATYCLYAMKKMASAKMLLRWMSRYWCAG